MELSPDQLQALDACLERLDAKCQALLCGAAGTGKTTLMGSLAQQRSILCMAPTNAAARVLRRKLPDEIPVSTIHKAAMNLSGQTHDRIIRFWERLMEHLVSTGTDESLSQCSELQSIHNDLEPEQIQPVRTVRSIAEIGYTLGRLYLSLRRAVGRLRRAVGRSVQAGAQVQ